MHAAKNVIGPALLKSTCLVAHNADFDINIFKSELYRHELYELLEHMNKIKVVCTMKSTKDLIGSLNKFGKVKNPNLKELYTYATGREMENHHNSLYDVINLHEAISELLRSQRSCNFKYGWSKQLFRGILNKKYSEVLKYML